MDCYYAQVEAKRLGIDCRTTPLIAAQWDALIAVNYPARAHGIDRFDTVAEAQAKCPGVVVAGVATYKMGETTYRYHDCPDRATHKVALQPYRAASQHIFALLCAVPGVCVEKASVDEAYLDVTEAAQCELAEMYREVAHAAEVNGGQTKEAWMGIYSKQHEMNTSSSSSSMSVATRGVDQTAVSAMPLLDPLRDVLEPSTRLVEDRRTEMEAWCRAHGTHLTEVYDRPMYALQRYGALITDESRPIHRTKGSFAFALPTEMYTEQTEEARAAAERYHHTLLLCAASRVVRRLRDRIYRELRFDCSAGIAHNRLLAKCISARHKPNQQTLLLPDRAAAAVFDLPLSKMHGFGGKLGEAVRRVCGAQTERCCDVWLVPLSKLSALDRAGGSDGDSSSSTSSQSVESMCQGSDDDGESMLTRHAHSNRVDRFSVSPADAHTGAACNDDTRGESDKDRTDMCASSSSLSTLDTIAAESNDVRCEPALRVRPDSFMTPTAWHAWNDEAHATAMYVYYRVRGFASDTVKPRAMAKIIMASKNFRPGTTRMAELRQWIVVLANELASRYADFARMYRVEAHSLNIKLGCRGLQDSGGVCNRTCATPCLITAESVTTTVVREIVRALQPSSLPASATAATHVDNFAHPVQVGAAALPAGKQLPPPSYTDDMRIPFVNIVSLTLTRFTPHEAGSHVQRSLTSYPSRTVTTTASAVAAAHNDSTSHTERKAPSPQRTQRGRIKGMAVSDELHTRHTSPAMCIDADDDETASTAAPPPPRRTSRSSSSTSSSVSMLTPPAHAPAKTKHTNLVHLSSATPSPRRSRSNAVHGGDAAANTKHTASQSAQSSSTTHASRMVAKRPRGRPAKSRAVAETEACACAPFPTMWTALCTAAARARAVSPTGVRNGVEASVSCSRNPHAEALHEGAPIQTTSSRRRRGRATQRQRVGTEPTVVSASEEMCSQRAHSADRATRPATTRGEGNRKEGRAGCTAVEDEDDVIVII